MVELKATLEDYLIVENDSEIFNFRFEFDDILMWPFIRYILYRTLLFKDNDIFNSYKSGKHYNFYDNLSYIKNTIVNSPYKKKLEKYDILMFCSGITNVKRGNNYFNRISDYFALSYKDETLLIEDSVDRKYRSPRYFPNICYHDFIFLIAYIQSKFIKINEKDILTIENLLKYLKQRLSNKLKKSDLDAIKNSLTYISKKLKIYHRLYNKLFDKFNPKIIFLEDASYGARSYILKWAKERGVLTAELQHGCISKNHPAYNYSDIILNSDIYIKYLPDYFLTYGKYWNEQINIPVKKIVIGNPNYLENIKKLNFNKKIKNRKKILVISQWTVSDIMKKIAIELDNLLDKDKYDIVFRPHPAELSNIENCYFELLRRDRIKIDTETDIYVSFKDTDFLIGASSTALFEAMGICKSIFVINYPFVDLVIPKDIKRFSNSKELAYFIQNDNPEENEIIDTNYIWERNWENNYTNFINGLLNL